MSLPSDRMICYSRLCTPPEHLDILIEPSAARVYAALQSQSDAAFANVPILDTTLAALRTQLRRRLELGGPVILCGHQAGVLPRWCVREERCHARRSVYVWRGCDLPQCRF